jgi:inorganic phosphate transporter, PiT family
VAGTIGHGIVNYTQIGPLPLSGGIAGGLSAVLLSYWFRFPTSGSVALVSSTIGSLLAIGKLGAIQWHGVGKVAISLFGSIFVGFAGGALVFVILLALLARVDYRTGMRAMRLQYVSVALQAFGYGANDAEKMMGLIVAALLIGHPSAPFVVPFWVIAAAVFAFAAGMAIGGARIARTIGGKLFTIRPLHALSFQIAAAATVLTAAALGGPLSTTEATASSILGVGAAANPRAVRWLVARDLVLAWVITVPVGAICGVALTLLLQATHAVR